MNQQNHKIAIMALREMGCSIRKHPIFKNSYFVKHRNLDHVFLLDPSCSYPFVSKWQSVLMRNKSLLNFYLKQNGIRTTTGDTLLFKYNNKTQSKKIVRKITKKTGFPVFAKPLNGSFSKGVALCNNLNELEQHINNLRINHSGCLIEKYVSNMVECRIFVFRGKIQYLYSKKRIFIIGDGKKRFMQLVKDAAPTLETMFDKNYAQKNLALHGLTTTSVIPQKLEIDIHPRQISQLGTFETTKFPILLKKEMKKIFEITKIDVFGIDCFVDNVKKPEKIKVIEINGNPSNEIVYYKYGEKKTVINLFKKIYTAYLEKHKE